MFQNLHSKIDNLGSFISVYNATLKTLDAYLNKKLYYR